MTARTPLSTPTEVPAASPETGNQVDVLLGLKSQAGVNLAD